MDPYSGSWEPDPSGRRLATIRVARRGAVLAAVLFAPLGLVANSLVPSDAIVAPWFVLVVGLPGIALLGAALTPSALGSRIDAVAVGVAMAIGVPVAAVASALIGALVIGAVSRAGGFPGSVLRAGVTTSLQLSPLIVAASVVWVVLVRRWGARLPRAVEKATESERVV